MASNEDVSDYGIECLKKAARVPDTSLPTRYVFRTNLLDSNGNIIDLETNADGQLKVVLDGKVDDNNTSTTPLNSGATFTGTATNTLDYALVFVTVYSDVASATDGLKVEMSSDGTTWFSGQGDVFTVPAATQKTYSIQTHSKFYRVTYENGGTNQTTFDLQAILKKTNSKPSSHRVQDSISDDDDGELVKAVITGKNPQGNYVNFQATAAGNFKTSIEEIESGVVIPTSLPDAYFDDFGKLGVAGPHKLYEYSANYPIDTVRYHDTDTTGSGTVTRNATKTQIELATTTASGDEAIFQTRRNIQYNKGNAQEITFIYRPNPAANRRERWGPHDDNNGIFFEHDGTDARIVLRSNTSGSIVDTKFEQADWDDPLDGNGDSGLTIDWTNQTIFKITWGWLSSRGFRAYVDVGGTFVLVKKHYISNTLTVPFMATACLPMRFAVTNTGTVGSSNTSSFTCFAFQSSGSDIQEGPVRALDTGTSAVSINSTASVFAGVRLNSSFLNGSIQPLSFTLLPTSGTAFVYYRAIYNPSLTGGTWTASSDGIYDYLSVMPSAFSGGSVVASGYFALGSANKVDNATLQTLLSDIYVGRGIDDSQDALVLVLETTTGTGNCLFATEFKEFT